ncbi:hypothetical protein J6590_095565 [Homalodisca vitripennis]|nr:hypothetical protein J6590_095565 [Homalodisca vitripennis]
MCEDLIKQNKGESLQYKVDGTDKKCSGHRQNSSLRHLTQSPTSYTTRPSELPATGLCEERIKQNKGIVDTDLNLRYLYDPDQTPSKLSTYTARPRTHDLFVLRPAVLPLRYCQRR